MLLRNTFAMSLPVHPDMERSVKPASPPSLPADVLTAIFDIITSVYGAPGCRALLCRDAQVTTRTGQHWMLRTHAPRVSHLFNMMAARPEFKKAIQSLIERI